MFGRRAAMAFGTAGAGATAAGFVNGGGSVGAILGGLLPGVFNAVTVFMVFAVCAMFSALVLVPHWNSRPGGLKTNHPFVPNRAMNIKPLRT